MSFIDLCLVVLALAFVLTLVRVALGPTPADRGLAADVGYLVVLGAIALVMVREQAAVLADVILVATVVGFLALLAFAWYVDRRSP